MSTLRVSVANAAPVYRRGLFDLVIQLGFIPVEPRSLITWVATTPDAMVIVALYDRDDMRVLHEVCAAHKPTTVVVALVPEPSPCWYAEALVAGAHAVVELAASAEAIVEALSAASRHLVILPSDIARVIASHAPTSEPVLDDSRIQWLQRLASGATIDELASEIGYSRRATYRRLRDLYHDLGTDNRTSALIAATRFGLLES